MYQHTDHHTNVLDRQKHISTPGKRLKPTSLTAWTSKLPSCDTLPDRAITFLMFIHFPNTHTRCLNNSDSELFWIISETMHMGHFLMLKSSRRSTKAAEEELCVRLRPVFSAASYYHYKVQQQAAVTLKYFPFWNLQSGTYCRAGAMPTRRSLTPTRGSSDSGGLGKKKDVERCRKCLAQKHFLCENLTACGTFIRVCGVFYSTVMSRQFS